MIVKIKLVAFLLMLGSFSFGQMEQFNYKRVLTGVTKQWHEIVVPNAVFSKTSQNLTDIRVFVITESGDTLIAPYLLKVAEEQITTKEIAFKELNVSHTDKGSFFTFEILTKEAINEINLDFGYDNFDWKITLEGSQNQNEWFTILDDYRVLSIKNEWMNFQFTKLIFPSSKYRYFRLKVESKERPKLTRASISQNEIIGGKLNLLEIKKRTTTENKEHKQTEIAIEMKTPVRASSINLPVSNNFDYYRPLTISYLSDSFKTEQGWKYNYTELVSGTLNSIEKNEFKFSPTTFQHLLITIDNQDNQALTIGEIKVKGSVHSLVARFTEPATYYLVYGNPNAERTNYDIERFTTNIPTNLSAIEIGAEEQIEKGETKKVEPLFKNKKWLWGIMGIVILVLGWFSVSMMRKS